MKPTTEGPDFSLTLAFRWPRRKALGQAEACPFEVAS
jgi:hypothetical protein